MGREVSVDSEVWLDLDMGDARDNDDIPDAEAVNESKGVVVQEPQPNLFVVKLDEFEDGNGDPFHIAVSLDEVKTYEP